jgi:uncharacterized coiled-coil DUF342 family protein
MDDLVGELREQRSEMREGFRKLREEMRELRAELGEEIREVRVEVYSTRRWTVNLWATTVVGFVAVLIQSSLR